MLSQQYYVENNIFHRWYARHQNEQGDIASTVKKWRRGAFNATNNRVRGPTCIRRAIHNIISYYITEPLREYTQYYYVIDLYAGHWSSVVHRTPLFDQQLFV